MAFLAPPAAWPLLVIAALATMAWGHDHHEGNSKILAGDAASKDPVVGVLPAARASSACG